MLSDEDIRQALGKDIVIEPFSDRSLSPVGYDLRVGDFVYVLDGGPLSSPALFRDDPLLQPRREVYSIPARATVQILSKEIVWVSRRIAGTLHSKVSLVTKGLSPISTTLDPGWFGPFLITFTNQSDRPIEVRTTDTFATIVFHRLATPTRRASVRQDLQVIDQLQDQSQEYVAKMGALMKDDLFTVFKARVDSANRPVAEKIVAGTRSAALSNGQVEVRGFGQVEVRTPAAAKTLA